MLWSPSSTRSSRARSGLGRPVDPDQVLVGHIADQDPDDAEGKGKPCGCRRRVKTDPETTPES